MGTWESVQIVVAFGLALVDATLSTVPKTRQDVSQYVNEAVAPQNGRPW